MRWRYSEAGFHRKPKRQFSGQRRWAACVRTPAICRVFQGRRFDPVIGCALSDFAVDGDRDRAFGHRASVAQRTEVTALMRMLVIRNDLCGRQARFPDQQFFRATWR
jgi:hypothetical protein